MKFLDKIFTLLQKVGQSLMIPVSVLPAAGLLVAMGRILKDNFIEISIIKNLGEILFSGGISIFEQLPVIFAMGVAVGFSQGAGVAALSAAVGYFTLFNVLKVISGFSPGELAINTGVFGGIATGSLAAYLYNRFHETQLNPIFGFFSGKRLIPILSAGSCLILGLALGVTWPPIQHGIQHFGHEVMTSDWGPGLYAAGKRLLIPLGLHHVYYPPFLFEFGEYTNSAGQILRGESARYFGGDPAAGKFMASEFPIMLFGLPMAALAMVLRAPSEKRKLVGGVMLSAALTSIITGITEPIEFAFIFVAPILFVVHVILAFLSGILTSQFDIHLGYTFSASLIDFIVGFFNQKNSLSLWLIVGPLIGLTYFGTFYFLIGLFNLKTIGREIVENITQPPEKRESNSQNEKARQILLALGGKENIDSIDACITRLRVTVKQASLVKKDNFKSLGAAGTMNTGNNFQIVFGVQSDKIKEEIKSIIRLDSSTVDLSKSNLKDSKEIEPDKSLSTNEYNGFLIPIQGDILHINQTPDETFAEKVLGEGFLIDPSVGLIQAPFDGEVMHLFPTNHAIILKRTDGMEALIHIGIDTVKMKGEGFTPFVSIGDAVHKGQKLIEFDLALVKQKAKSHLTPIVFTNPELVVHLPNEFYKIDISNNTHLK
ncbi:MAG: glucose PTS transporter subunit IIA [Bdellovibrionaceae bacterium]|nr:glucose PTS transporter subunit IIA [Pseudobdellovibrionaceae bacterium]NUM59864.1 PTS transporter subunit EIIC [Pseudobdellovibrionaceae bacterium]